MTVDEWAKDFRSFVNELKIPRDDYKDIMKYIDDAIALLKEQVAVEPKYNARTNWYECGACHYSMTSGMHCRSELIPAYKVGYCAKCGKAVKWNA